MCINNKSIARLYIVMYKSKQKNGKPDWSQANVRKFKKKMLNTQYPKWNMWNG